MSATLGGKEQSELFIPIIILLWELIETDMAMGFWYIFYPQWLLTLFWGLCRFGIINCVSELSSFVIVVLSWEIQDSTIHTQWGFYSQIEGSELVYLGKNTASVAVQKIVKQDCNVWVTEEIDLEEKGRGKGWMGLEMKGVLSTYTSLHADTVTQYVYP